MAQELSVAMKTAKDIEKGLVQNENRLAYIQSEVKRLTDTKEALQAQIEKKRGDYEIYMSGRDAENKKIRQSSIDAAAQLEKDKAEFAEILGKFKADKASHEDEKSKLIQERKKIEVANSNVREFIIAVQRALSVLGI